MSAIFDKANSFSINRFPSVRRAVSIGGIARSESVGPSFFYITCSLPPMYEVEYRKVSSELSGIGDGAQFLTSTLPHGHNKLLGNYSGNVHATTAVAGRVVTVNGFDPSGQNEFRAGDVIQFPNDTKVYEIIEDADANASGVVSFTVHTDFIETPTIGNFNTNINLGPDVEYKLMLINRPQVNSVPGMAGDPLYEFDTAFEFREVL